MGKKTAAFVAASMLALSMSVTACGTSTEPAKSDEQEAKQEQPQKQDEQVFDTELAIVTYRDTQDAVGNAVVNFALENKTDKTLMVGSDGLLVNGQYSVTALGGSVADIAPSTTGSVSLTFGVSTQTDLGGTEDLQTLSGELVLFDADEMQEVGRVPFDVVI